MLSLLPYIVSGLSIGFIGSFHCIGMCGPLALSLPVQHLSWSNRTLKVSLYHIGRAISYALIGVMLGFLSSQIKWIGVQQIFSVAIGVGLLFTLPLWIKPNSIPSISKFTAPLQKRLSRLLMSEKNNFTYVQIGMLNGLLPCGMVYVAAATAAATLDVSEAAAMMFAFGLGTFPMMFGVTVLGTLISLPFRRKIQKVQPYLIAAIAILLIARGLEADIPYLNHLKGTIMCSGR